jgi:SAM-dependent methyltransferase
MGEQFEITMDSEQYDRWYYTPRGQWIGHCELELLFNALKPRPGESLLDVGCGTGFFTREMGARIKGAFVGVDINQNWIRYACQHDSERASYAVADARALPFCDAAFNMVISVAALCFIPDIHVAIREMIRVTRRSFAIGLLNCHSILWLKKGSSGGHGAYRGARWHTVNEAVSLFSGLPVKNLIVQTAVHMPGGGKISQWVERCLPTTLSTGAFILIKGDVIR